MLLFSGATLILDPLPVEGDERPTSGAIAVGLALGELTLGVLTPDGATGSGLGAGAAASGPIDGLLGGIAVEGDAFAFGNSDPVGLTSEAVAVAVEEPAEGLFIAVGRFNCPPAAILLTFVRPLFID